MEIKYIILLYYYTEGLVMQNSKCLYTSESTCTESCSRVMAISQNILSTAQYTHKAIFNNHFL